MYERNENNPKICNYLDMPLQHGSTKILKAMRRGITREKTEELIAHIRDEVPGIALRTTLIAGYPGETEADFQEMYDWVERSRFDRLGYSHILMKRTHMLLILRMMSHKKLKRKVRFDYGFAIRD